MKSIWSETKIPPRHPLTTDQEVEAAVIGAGMAGILTAYFLSLQGMKVIVLEADRIGSGQTQNTTAKITSQHGMIYKKLIKTLGSEKARLYGAGNQAAIDKYQEIIERENISCDFERLPAYLYSTKDKKELILEAEAASSLGLPAHFCEKVSLPFQTKGAVCFDRQAQFHPLKFIHKLSEKLNIYENTRVLKVKGHLIRTNRGEINAQQIIFAAHYPMLIMPGFYFLRLHQDRSYVTAYEGAKPLTGIYYSADQGGLSYRSYGNLLLAGGSSHRTGKNYLGGCYEKIRVKVNQEFPGLRERTYWSAQDCITHDGLPLIGKYSFLRPYWHVITGFGKWGMSFSMLGAMILSDSIAGRENPYARLFSPQRCNFFSSVKSFMVDFRESASGLLWLHDLGKLPRESELSNGQGGVVRKGILRYGCYRDENGTPHRISLRCPHMGCELSWNPDDKSWDCPCHGSRFDRYGNLIDAPAKVGVKS